MLAAVTGSGGGDAGAAPGLRRRVAIAFADVVGYSTLMAADESGTYARWMALFAGSIEPELLRRGGRVVDMAGDGVLAEFPDASEAVDWARCVQRGVRAGRPQDAVPADPVPIALRIGIHVGEIYASGPRIFGDAVNFAARLQTHAPPGGIIVSEAARGGLRADLETELRDIGFAELKGFDRPARLFAIETDLVSAAVPLQPSGGLPSIAVLPLLDRGGDSDKGFLADGIAEDVVMSLAGLHELFVVSSASSAVFRGRQPDPREAGRVLGVRYVLQGGLRRSGERLGVSVQLCDARTGAVVWGERMRAPVGEVFEVQEEIVRKVVAGIAPQVRAAELLRAMRKRPESLTAYDRMLRALHVMGSADRDTFESGRKFLAEAMAEEPGFALPVAWAARWRSVRIGRGWSPSPEQDGAEALALATRAVAMDRDNALALATLGHLKSILLHDCDAAMECFAQALLACPNHALAWTLSSGTLSYLGRGAEAVRRAESGLHLSPQDPLRYAQFMFLGIAHYADGAYPEALRYAQLSAAENPLHGATLRLLTAALAAMGRTDEARRAGVRLLALDPNFSVSRYNETRLPFREPTLRAALLDHLRQAGLPD